MSAEQTMTESPIEAGSGTAHEGYGDGDGFEAGGDEENRSQPGMGQSKSSRRRRRKRKGKGAEAAEGSTGAVAPMPGEVIGGVQASGSLVTAAEPAESAPARAAGDFRAASSQPQGSGGRNPGGQQGSNAPGGPKRWKKKNFRERDRNGRPGENQGNGFAGSNNASGGFTQQSSSGQGSFGQSFSGQGNHGGGFRGPDTHQPGNGGSFKRKGGFAGKQRSGGSGGGSRGGFVGPMDHSYRPPNGNIFEAGPSMSESYGGNGRGRNSFTSDSQPIDYSQGRVIPIKEGTPTRIFFFIEDLFFTAKIQETARKLGVKVEFVKNEKEKITQLTSGEGEEWPGLIVFDLNNANAKPLTLIPKLKTKLKKHTSIIGFLSHLQGDLKAKAVEAGCDTVMPRAAFSQNLPNLLRRYGIEEVDETNYNQ